MRIDISSVLKNGDEQIDFDTQLDLTELAGAYGEKAFAGARPSVWPRRRSA